MNTYKALITDLDGTAVKLASDGSDVSSEAAAAIKVATRKGYKITCATGRRWDYAKPIVKGLGISEACIIEGGTRIINPVTEETVWEKHLESKTLEHILTIFKKNATGGLISTLQLVKTPLQDVDRVDDDARFIYILAISLDEATAICEAVGNLDLVVAHKTPSWYGDDLYDVHVTHAEATKEHAIKVWQEIEGVTMAETIGMGDGGNDLPLFESVGLKVAVGNATQELKDLADYIAPPEDEQALVHVIERFLV